MTERVSLDSTGAQAMGDSSDARVSEDGRYVVFSTYAALVSLDTNGVRDVYRYDRNTGTVDLASMAGTVSSPVVSNADSMNPSVSNDGLFVAFETLANNLGTNMADTNGFSDIYVREYSASGGITNRVSINFCPLPTLPALQGNGHSRFPDISAETFFLPGVGNVHLIVFESDATNLDGDPNNGCALVDTNGTTDIFFSYEGNAGWLPGTTSPVTHLITFNSGLQGNGASGGQGIPAAAVSAAADFVAFSSSATNLVGAGVDTNNMADVFVVDIGTGAITRVSVDSSGAQATGGPSTYPAVNADASRVAFQSTATNLVSGGNSTPDVYVHDLTTGATIQASQSTGGSTGNASSGRPDISADGAFVAFESQATNLYPGDSNGVADVFVHSVLGRSTLRSSLSSANAQGNLGSTDVCLTENGSQMVFTSDATNLVSGDTNSDSDVFFRGCDSQASVYCTAKVNSLSCVPSISFNGSPSATVGSGFHLTTRNLINQTTGLYLFSVDEHVNPFQVTPFQSQGGWICVASQGAALNRSPGAATGGSASGTDCSGVIDMDFNTVLATWTAPVIQMGDTIYVQCWSRDVADPFGSSFSDAVSFTVCD